MKYYHTNFDTQKPYKVISLNNSNNIKFKITQPLKLWLFGFTVRYYDVCEWALRSRYKHTKYFLNKKEVDNFIEEQTKTIQPYSEFIVFDSLREIP